MPPFYLPWTYLLGLTVWLAALFGWLVWCLKLRLLRKRAARSQRLPNILLSCWCLLSLLTLAEILCAFVVDQSDGSNMTNISKRWFRKHIEAQRNKAGFRDRRELTRLTPPGVRRIAFFGDSFTIGHGVNRCEDRFTDRFEALLEQAQPGKYQVANFGEPGMETSQIESLVRATFDQDYQIDTVVYVFMLNDIEGYDPQTEQIIQSLRLVEPKFFLVSQTYFPNWVYFRCRQAVGRGGEYFPHLRKSYFQAPWDGLKRKLDQLRDNCRDHQVDFRMVIFPFLHNLGPDYPYHAVHEKLRQYCEEAEIPVLDLEPVLLPHASEGLTANRDDAHPNERAHALVAEALKEQLFADLFSKVKTKDASP